MSPDERMRPPPSPAAPARPVTEAAHLPAEPVVAAGSRRRRIWELSPHAQCPVIGVCLPLPLVRRLANKVLGGETQATDYELHCGVNSECKLRNRLSLTVNKALDQRYERAVRDSRTLRSTEELARWWDTGSASGHNLPGVFWATLTHPRCTPALEESVLQDVHMIQHQAGAADRADQGRMESLLAENRVLARELAAAQQRVTRMSDESARRIEHLQAELMKVRADLIGRDTVVASLWDELRQLEADVPGLRSRTALTRQVAEQIERLQDLERALMRSRHDAERERHRAETALAELHGLRQARSGAAEAAPPRTPSPTSTTSATPTAPAGPATPAPVLADQAVLCVGGRGGNVPAYRHLLEQEGARFLHHDGGEEDNAARLDHTLAAADLVICQTGCISHDAYWRVKDHCKRTGKPCLFVDNPSRSSLQRALVQWYQPRANTGPVDES